MIFFFFALAFGSNECAVLIDAGSSGSRFWIYSWTADSSSWQNDVPSDLNAEESYKVEPGIIEYFDDTTAMEEEFQVGLDNVLAFIQEEEDRCQDTGDIVLWLMATAGLRTESSDDVKEILDAIGVWFEANAPFDWLFGVVLSGEEEATYAWIANNYVLGRLGDGDEVGIMEMGGQSFQIAFKPADEIIMDNSFDLELFGTTFRIYAKSWNGFGIDALLDNLDEMLSTDEGKKFLNWNGTAYSHPCLQEGWYDGLSSKLDWPLAGYYDSVNCSLLLEYFFEQYSISDVCDYNECSIAGAYISDMENIDIYALSNFYYRVDALNGVDDSLGFSPSLSSFSQATEAMCELNITELASQMEDYYPIFDVLECYKSKITYQIESMLPNLGVSGTVTYGKAENENGIEGTWLLGALIQIMYSAAVEEYESEEYKSGNDNMYLPYFILFLVAFVLSTSVFGYAYTRDKVNVDSPNDNELEM